ncbi:sugar ABC transporter ATP-binding protein [Microbacterium allomyrinae]|uniref:Sugar ABC transporter ATP-binding protein n=1 Tax=Microbacterium allomyrinae TaxID=2830666 RepID=A0A9X1LSI3_9MICO|nr:sugar ABC transporter ATP-binding protein [Microbacterium allomyrinae]MCC2031234.1 sugar ABC transporter ATP-binding protein [Microbacterium allomyrinae]
MSAPRLEVTSLSKTFAGVTVLKDAHLEVHAGEVHALIGQNGSGKSTLIKLISGVYRADRGGEVLVDGKRIGAPVDPATLHDEGLAFVHQDLGLIPDLSVRENVRVGRHSTRRFTGWIDTRKDSAAVRETLDFLNLGHISPDTKVQKLRPSEKVGVAIARALQERVPGSGVVVFDESSRSIPHEALPDFYAMVRLLTSQGTAVIIVSHNLTEVLQIADRVTALRNGRVIEMGVPIAQLDEAKLTRMVLGRNGELADFAASMPSPRRVGGIELRDVRGGRIRRISASVSRGEVVGFTGSIDSGLSSLAPLLAGALTGTGVVRVDGRELSLENATISKALDAGVAYIPQDRHGEGLATELTVEENVTLPHLRRRGKPWWTGVAWQRDETDAVLQRFAVTPADRHAAVAGFSGGNQQKLLMGKWLMGSPVVLVLDDPTQAVDVGARASVLRATRQAAVDGAAVVLCSSEVEDLASVCDRVYILEEGRVVNELTGPFTADTIFSAIFHDSEGTDR